MARGYTSIFDGTVLYFQSRAEAVLDDNDNLVVPDSGPLKKVNGDLQPIPMSRRKQLEAPSGFTLSDSKYFSTKTTLKTINDIAATGADYTIINGREFYVWEGMDYSSGPLSTDKYKEYILVMKSMQNDL